MPVSPSEVGFETSFANQTASGALTLTYAVEKYRAMTFAQTTSGIALTTAAPVDATIEHELLIVNTGTTSFTWNGLTVAAASVALVAWTGSGWALASGAAANNVLASYMFGIANASQNPASGAAIVFQTTNASYGSDIALNTTTGVLTLQPGKTYKLVGAPGWINIASGNYFSFQWYNVTAAAAIGNGATWDAPATGVYADAGNPAIAYITPTVVTQVELQVVHSGGVTNVGTAGTYPWFTCEVVSGALPLTGTSANFMHGHLAASKSLASGAIVPFDTIDAQSGSLISNASGAITLTAGYTYRLRGSINMTNGGRAGAYWNVTSGATTGPIGQAQAFYSPSDTAGNAAAGSPAEAVITPGVTTVVSLTINNATVTVSGGDDFAFGAGTTGAAWFDVEVLGAPATQQFTGATATVGGASGYVPAPTAGQQVNFLRGDGTWATAPTTQSPVAATLSLNSLNGNGYATVAATDWTIAQPTSARIILSTNNYIQNNGFTVGANSITVPSTGTYAINADLALYIGVTGQMGFGLYKNGVAVGGGVCFDPGSGEAETASLTMNLACVAGDILDFRVFGGQVTTAICVEYSITVNQITGVTAAANMLGATATVAGAAGFAPAPAAGQQNNPLLGSATFALNTQIADTGTSSVIQNGTAAGAVSLFATTTTGNLAIGGAQTTGTLALGNASMTGAISLTSSTLNLGAGANAATVNIATGAASNAVNIGSATSTIQQTVGPGGFLLVGTAGAPIVLANGITTGAITLGGSLTTGTLTFGGASTTGNISIPKFSTAGVVTNTAAGVLGTTTAAALVASAFTNLVFTDTSSPSVSSIAADPLSINAGNGTLNLGTSAAMAGGVVNLGTSVTSGAINIGTSLVGSISIGNAASSPSVIISSAGNILLGNAASGNIVIGNGTTVGTVSVGTAITTGYVNIATAMTSGVTTIGNTTVGGLFLNGNGSIQLNGSGSGTISIGSSHASGLIQIGGGSADTISLNGGTGQINIGTASTTGTITLGGASMTGTFTIGNSAMSGLIQLLTTGNITIGGGGAATNSFGASVTTGTVNIGAQVSTGTINIGSTSMSGALTVNSSLLEIGGPGSALVVLGNGVTTGGIALGVTLTTGALNIGNASMTAGNLSLLSPPKHPVLTIATLPAAAAANAGCVAAISNGVAGTVSVAGVAVGATGATYRLVLSNGAAWVYC